VVEAEETHRGRCAIREDEHLRVNSGIQGAALQIATLATSAALAVLFIAGEETAGETVFEAQFGGDGLNVVQELPVLFLVFVSEKAFAFDCQVQGIGFRVVEVEYGVRLGDGGLVLLVTEEDLAFKGFDLLIDKINGVRTIVH